MSREIQNKLLFLAEDLRSLRKKHDKALYNVLVAINKNMPDDEIRRRYSEFINLENSIKEIITKMENLMDGKD